MPTTAGAVPSQSQQPGTPSEASLWVPEIQILGPGALLGALPAGNWIGKRVTRTKPALQMGFKCQQKLLNTVYHNIHFKTVSSSRRIYI